MSSELDKEIIKRAEESSKEENLETKTEKVITKVTDTDSDIQDRLYFRVFDDNVDIMYRPAHQYIGFVKADKEGIREIKNLLSLDRETFKMTIAANIMFQSVRIKERNSDRFKHLEDWYIRAWSEQTNKFVEQYNLVIPKEKVIYQEEILKMRA